jgi:hypothetical protein
MSHLRYEEFAPRMGWLMVFDSRTMSSSGTHNCEVVAESAGRPWELL